MPSELLARCPAWLCGMPQQALAALQTDDAVLRLALYCVVGLTALTLLVMLQVLLLSEVAKRRARRRQQFNDLWRPYFALCSLADTLPEAAAPPARTQELWFLLQWNRTQMQLRGASQQRMNQALLALGMHRRALELLRGRVRARLIGLTCLRHLGDAQYWDAVQPLLHSRNTVVSLAAAQTLVAMNPDRAMQIILPAATRRLDWALPRLANLCLQAGEQAVTLPLMMVLNDLGSSGHRRLVALLVHCDSRHAAPWARARLDESASAEQLQVALRCLGELGDPRDRPRLQLALTHEQANVRLAALQALHKQAGRDDDVLFVPLLSDSSWWVRQAAADSLASMPGATPERLTRLLLQVRDRYGQDALRRALAETQR